jgi:hypothetical protein
MWKVCEFNQALGAASRRFSFHSALDAYAYAYEKRQNVRSFLQFVVYSPGGAEVSRVMGVR